MNAAIRSPMSREEFFAWAERQDGRYEFDGFQPVAMTGGTNHHGALCRNLNALLHLRLRGTPCQSMPPEGGGVATAGNKVRYPDAVVTCSPVDGRSRLIPDPVVVFEVLSPSSHRTDTVLKLREYHAITSIKRYVLVEQTGIGLTVYARVGGEAWTATALIEGDMLELPEIGVTIPVTEIYEGVTFEDEEGAGQLRIARRDG